MDLHDLRVTVESIGGRAVCGLRVGDYFEVTNSSRVTVPRHFCLYALAAAAAAAARQAAATCPPRTGWRATASSPAPTRTSGWSCGSPGPAGGRCAPATSPERAGRGRRVRNRLPDRQAAGRYGALAAAAEAHGFDVVSVFADLLYQPPLPALLEMARATSRVRLGAACFNPYTLHPYEIAGQVAALDAVSAGRAYLGLARGAWLGAIGITQSRPLATAARGRRVARRPAVRRRGPGSPGRSSALEPGTRLTRRAAGPGPAAAARRVGAARNRPGRADRR